MFGLGKKSEKIWGASDVNAISQEMMNRNKGKRHGYSNADILSAMRGMESQFNGKSISFVADQILSILSGGGSY
ncbi:MAG TPA: hypothetical protein PLS49_07400 [Candidatus Woesebacteria bacterium]|nr:hypothetical protein [Candidatus Woesebacteria bacterium]